MKIDYVIQETSLGWMLLAQTERGICALNLADSPENLLTQLQAEYPKAECHENPQALAQTVKQVLPYLEAPTHRCDLPIDIPKGTDFQQMVWRQLCTIPLGQTVSYKQLSEQLNKPKAIRAVASACGKNPVAILVPCHRVLASDGGLGGYSLGLERKRALLVREGVKLPPKAEGPMTSVSQPSLIDES